MIQPQLFPYDWITNSVDAGAQMAGKGMNMIHGTTNSPITMDRVRTLLDNGQAQEALALVNQRDDVSDVWQNVRAVCLLRMGSYERAMQVLRRIVFPGNAICVPEDVPALYRANFATAMLALHHTDSALAIMEHLGHDGHPYVEQVTPSDTAMER